MELRNESGLAFTDITSECWREYIYPDGHVIRIEEPEALNVSKSGGHRLLDGEGISHYIPKGWRHLKWKVAEGAPHFVK
jgi:hypothetical protein